MQSPNPAETPNPPNRPPAPDNRRGTSSNLVDASWFIAGLVVVALLVIGFGFWLASPSSSEEAKPELGYELLQHEVREGTVTDLYVSGYTVEGRFTTTRQAFDGNVRGSSEPVPEGYSQSDAEDVNVFTATIPAGEREQFVELAESHDIPIETN